MQDLFLIGFVNFQHSIGMLDENESSIMGITLEKVLLINIWTSTMCFLLLKIVETFMDFH